MNFCYIKTDRHFCTAEPEEVEAVIDYLKSEMGPSLEEDISEKGAMTSLRTLMAV